MVFINEMLLLKGDKFKVNDKISLIHPTLNEIMDFEEDRYFKIVNLFCATPYDYLVELDDNGIDWCEKTSYDVFIMAFNDKAYIDEINWLFDGKYYFQHAMNQETQETVLYDETNGIVIDRLTYDIIASYLRRINFLSETPEFVPANKFAKDIIIEEKRRELKRLLKNPQKRESQLSNLISFLAWNNTSGMKYNDIFQLHIYQFHDGLRRLQKTEHYRNIMFGYYTGNINNKNINFKDIDWMGKTGLD